MTHILLKATVDSPCLIFANCSETRKNKTNGEKGRNSVQFGCYVETFRPLSSPLPHTHTNRMTINCVPCGIRQLLRKLRAVNLPRTKNRSPIYAISAGGAGEGCYEFLIICGAALQSQKAVAAYLLIKQLLRLYDSIDMHMQSQGYINKHVAILYLFFFRAGNIFLHVMTMPFSPFFYIHVYFSNGLLFTHDYIA